MRKKPCVLVICDGYGVGAQDKKELSALAQAQLVFLEYARKNYLYTELLASGQSVGLLAGEMGNSEVGHLTIGAGRVYQSIPAQIADDIDQNLFYQKLLDHKFYRSLLNNKSRAVHVLGLLSDGGVHSNILYIFELIKFIYQETKSTQKRIYIHGILDGRDVPPHSSAKYLGLLSNFIHENNYNDRVILASLHGRFYAMDRDNNGERINRSVALVTGEKLENTHDKTQELSDEYKTPELLDASGIINNKDLLLFANYRPDRMGQILQALREKFSFLDVYTLGEVAGFISLYSPEYKKQKTSSLTQEILTQTDRKILRIAETEKYAHVTYFLEAGDSYQETARDRAQLINSYKRKSFAQKPEMAALEITDKLLNYLDTQDNQGDFIVINYANMDMVGHTGDFQATQKACEIVDRELARVYKKVIEELDGLLFITGDHGNCEEMLYPSGEIKTSHTNNPVPLYILGKDFEAIRLEKSGYTLANIAPTVLDILGLEIPKHMHKSILDPAKRSSDDLE